MNVTENDLENYINTFISNLRETANQFIPAEYRENMLHLNLLPAKITGYVSTQFGIAIEYEPADNTSVHILRGSARIEDLLVQAPRALRRTAPHILIGAKEIGFYETTFSGQFPFRLTTQEASAFFVNVTFSASQWERFIHFAEVYGNRLLENWNNEKAIERAKDEVLAALVDVQKARQNQLSLPDYVKEFKKNTVLLLGDYSETGIVRLERIKNVLEGKGYISILLKDIPDIPYQNLRQKVTVIGGLARFVVVDDSSKSGHITELELCAKNDWVTVALRAGGNGGSWMTAGYSVSSKVILEYQYDPETSEVAIDTICKWAEDKLAELKHEFDSVYPWRNLGS